MDGLVLYSQYLNNIRGSVKNYELKQLDSDVQLSNIFELAKDIEDLSYLDTILSDVGTTGLFIWNKDFLCIPLRTPGKLDKQLYLGELLDFIDDVEIEGIEDQIIELCGDLADENSEINYKNLSIEELSLGEESEQSSLNLVESYKDEITKIFSDLQKLQNLSVEKSEVNLTVERVTETKVPIDEDIEEPECLDIENYYDKEVSAFLEDDEGEDETEEDRLESYDSDGELEEEEKLADEDELEENVVQDIIEEIEIDEDEGIGKYKEAEIEEDLYSSPEFEEATSFFLDQAETEVEPEKQVKIYKRKEKIVDSEYVTDVDDALAKALLAINDNFLRLPSITISIASKVKGKSKKLYDSMKVEEEK